jgi:Mlc titration factor MtfA (ptsG expression regulator)
MFGRKKGLPSDWETIAASDWMHWHQLTADERARVGEVADWLLRKKYWEVAHGFDDFVLTDEIRVLIATQAALLVIDRDTYLYRDVDSVIVWPTTIGENRGYAGAAAAKQGGDVIPVLGSAHSNQGPVLLAWDAVQAGARDPERGSNVVYHEFAHKIDMWDGGADGTPGFHNYDDEQRWLTVCGALYDALHRGEERPPLDPYGGTNEAEFFAVATEAFFNLPVALHEHRPELYGLLGEFYNQDPVARAAR